MKWIKCNLPWTFYGKWEDAPQMPDLDKEIKEHFGKLPQDMRKKLPANYESETYKKAWIAFRKFTKEVNVWCAGHPLYKKYQKDYGKYIEGLKKKSFCGKGLNKPGTKIQIRDGKSVKTLIIGDINPYGGECSDCMAFDGDKAVVIKYLPLK